MGLGYVKCDLWLGWFRYSGWVFVGGGMGGRFAVVAVGWWVFGGWLGLCGGLVGGGFMVAIGNV